MVKDTAIVTTAIDSYYRRRIENNTQAVDWYQFG